MDAYYIQTYARFGPYVIGMITGYLVYKIKSSQLKIDLTKVGLILNNNAKPINFFIANCMYFVVNFVGRINSLCLCWLSFECSNGRR